MQNIELFQLLGHGLQIPELVELNLKTATADARVTSGVINVDKLVLESDHLQLTAHGSVGGGGRLGLDARLTIDSDISNRIPPFLLDYFKSGGPDNSHYIDFAIGNTLSHPKTNLLESLLGERIEGQMTDLLKTILVKEKKHSSSPVPVPAMTPP